MLFLPIVKLELQNTLNLGRGYVPPPQAFCADAATPKGSTDSMAVASSSDMQVLIPASMLVGEGPVWEASTGTFYCVDIPPGLVYRYRMDTGELSTWRHNASVGAVCPADDGSLVLATKNGFEILDPATGAIRPLHNPEPDLPENRMNDGKCDRRGRFWAGTMDRRESGVASGALYRLTATDGCTRHLQNIYISNGLDWSPDDSTLYYTDSLAHAIWKFDFDLDAGQLSNRRLFAHVPENTGLPDGLCVDAEGYIWSAHWNGARITRYAPDGSVDFILPTPFPCPSSCCFGGPDLDQLMVTSARIALTAEQLAQFPLSGSVFCCPTRVRGQRMSLYSTRGQSAPNVHASRREE